MNDAYIAYSKLTNQEQYQLDVINRCYVLEPRFEQLKTWFERLSAESKTIPNINLLNCFTVIRSI